MAILYGCTMLHLKLSKTYFLKASIIKPIVLCLLLAQVQVASGQNSRYTYALGSEVSRGFIIRHHEYLGHLIKGQPTAVSISLWKSTYGAKIWEANYKYPDIVFKLGYHDLQNEEQLGKVITASTGMNFHLLGQPLFTNELQFYFGIGLAYATNPYNQDTNNQNIVISSPISYNGNLKLSYHHWFRQKLGVGIGVQLTHISNGAFKQPNNGINILSANLEVKYKISRLSPDYQPAPPDQILDRTLRFGVNARIGWAESTPIGSGSKPVYTLGVMAQKRVTLKSLIESGLEVFISKTLEYEIKHGPPLDGPTPDYKRVGLMVGHELIVNRLALVTQLGYYLYKPYYPNERIYSRIGLNYHFTSHLSAGITLKTHFAVAEVIEYGIGYRW